MARPLRFIQEGGALMEVTTRTFQSRLLLTPKPLLNRIIIGVLARQATLSRGSALAPSLLEN